MDGSVGEYEFGVGIFGGGFAVTSFPPEITAYVAGVVSIPISVIWVTGDITFKLYRNGVLVNEQTVTCIPYEHTYEYTTQVDNLDDGSIWHYEITNQFVTITSNPSVMIVQLLHHVVDTMVLVLTNPTPIVNSVSNDITVNTVFLHLNERSATVVARPQIEVILSSDYDVVINMGIVTYTANIIQNFGSTSIVPEEFHWLVMDKNNNVIANILTVENILPFKFINTDSYKYVDGEIYRVSVTAKIMIPGDNLVIQSSNIVDVIFNEVRAMIRARENRVIDIEQFLPEQFHGTDVHDLVKAYQHTLNTMYDDDSGVMKLVVDSLEKTTEWDILIDNTTEEFDETETDNYSDEIVESDIDMTEPSQVMLSRFVYEPSETDKISIIEKINRFSDLRDPYLVDDNYLSAYASDLGYNINMGFNYATTFNDGEVNSDNISSKKEIMMNIRHVIKSLPYWYKIKSTSKAFIVLMYSYGLVGRLVSYYTNNHKDFITESDALSPILANDGYYPTSHIGIRINPEVSTSDSVEYAVINKRIAQAAEVIESIKPITTVLHAISVAYDKYLTGDNAINMNISVSVRQIIRA